MKNFALVIGLLVLGASSLLPPVAHAGQAGVSFGIFYSSLSPYGEWISIDAGYYGWRPVGVAAGWRPYVYGRWVWTDYGWYWVTDEPWGWAVFHYGRWYYDDFYGWVWIPGYDWAPAWVEWRYGGPYVGWAPLGPYAVFRIGVGIHYSVRWRTPYSYWTFANCQYLTSPTLHRYVYRSENNARYVGRTRYAGSVEVRGGGVVTRGPDRGFVERRGNTRIERTSVVDVRERQSERIIREGDRQRIEVYRPRVEPRSEELRLDRPERVSKSERRLSLDPRSIDVGVRDAGRRMPGEEQRSIEMRRRDDGAADRSGAPAGSKPDSPRDQEKSIERREGERRIQEQGSSREPERKVNPGVERKTEPRPDARSKPRVQQQERQSESGGQVKRVPETQRRERSVESQRSSERSRDAAPARSQRNGRNRD